MERHPAGSAMREPVIKLELVAPQSQHKAVNVEMNLQMSYHTDAFMSASTAQTKVSTAYTEFMTEGHIPMATAAILRAWKYHVRGTRVNTAEMRDRTRISGYVTIIQQGPKERRGYQQFAMPSRGSYLNPHHREVQRNAGVQR